MGGLKLKPNSVVNPPKEILNSEFVPDPNEREYLEWALGCFGKQIFDSRRPGSKSYYLNKRPDELVVFKANVCTANKKIWYGDINLTEDIGCILTVARHYKEDIYVLNETDARWGELNLWNPVLCAKYNHGTITVQTLGTIAEFFEVTGTDSPLIKRKKRR